MKQTHIFNRPHGPIKPPYPFKNALWIVICLFFFCTYQPTCVNARQDSTCLNRIHPSDAVLMIAPEGQILLRQNETHTYIPASTLKILTALTAIHRLGLDYRFRTEFYIDADHNLIIKGYGDPLLTSEVLQEISGVIAGKITRFNHLILDNSYFVRKIKVPGVGNSTNPYDAPLGALCANFNTIFFDRDCQGRIISAEPQTPITPFARTKIRELGQEKGRYTFGHDPGDATRYAGELFLHFVKKKGIACTGETRLGMVQPEDRLIYTHQSCHSLKVVLKKMLEFSNNFIANQICIAMGVQIHGPPGTLEKGVSVISEYARDELHLTGLNIVEGSGISRQNRISAQDMILVLRGFRPYRQLLKRAGKILFKTGTLKGINTRAGYMDSPTEAPYPFVIFLNNGKGDIEGLIRCIEKQISH